LHETTLIATITAAFVAALTLGLLAAKLRVPPLVGYLLAGILIGPFTPGFVGDMSLASQLAEIGVILLMFGVGLHFSIEDLMAVRRIAVPGALVQIATATVIGGGLAWAWGWGLAGGLTFGLALSVASTVVLLRALEQQRALDSPEGRIAVGWLIVEDLAMVLALVLLPALAQRPGGAGLASEIAGIQGSPALLLALTVAKVAFFVGFALVVGKRVVPWLLSHIARTGSRELFTLGVLAIALGVAFGSAALFGVSFALGAFFAGVIMSESDLSQEAAEDSLPLQDAFAVLFFVSVGMLFDPAILLRQPLEVLAVVLIIVVGKSLAAFLIVLAFRYPVGTAMTVSASLAQIGEFSFILIGLGVTLELLPPAGRDLVLAGALLSITLNPAVFAALPAATRWLQRRPGLWARLQRHGGDAEAVRGPPAPVSGHAVVVGHGRVGAAITRVLANEGLPFVVVERDRPRFDLLGKSSLPGVFGDAGAPGILERAGIAEASLLIVATPDSFRARRVLELARVARPGIPAVIRTHSEGELQKLREDPTSYVVMGERELARTMLHHVLRQFGVPPERARLLVEDPSSRELEAEAERR
jgi:CPA2 family monovalent cation:H+ antiporter-2